MARRVGGTWSPVGDWSYGNVRALVVMPNGDIVAGGWFTEVDGVVVNNIARWNGTGWAPLGSGADGGVLALAVMPSGDLVAGGVFTVMGGVACSNIARWDGSAWSALGTGMGSQVNALVVSHTGELIAGSEINGAVTGTLARWNGTNWSAIAGAPHVSGMALLPNGGLVVGGPLSVGSWNGSAWSTIGYFGEPVYSVAALPNGEILAAGGLTIGSSGKGIVRWNGATWAPVVAGMDAEVRALLVRFDGSAEVGGTFTSVGTVVSPCHAVIATTCPATAIPTGTGCTGSAGPNVLAASTLPWIGSTFRARATGMPAFAFVLSVTGFSTTSLPLAAILPQGGAGCVLLASPDVVDVLLPTGGIATAQLVLPNTLALVGQTFHQQMLPLEVDAQFNFTALTSTNALSATIGAF